MKPLHLDKPLDANLKPIKDSDGTLSALELSTDTVRVKDLEVAGDIKSLGNINSNVAINGNLSLHQDSEFVVNNIKTTSEQSLLIDATGGSVRISDSSPTALSPSLEISCDDSAAYGGQMTTNHNSASPAVDDYIWFLTHYGRNDAAQDVGYCASRVRILNKDDGTECGSFILESIANGTGRNLITGSGTTGNLVNVDIGYGATSMTTIAGDLDIDGDAITTAGAIALDSGGAITLDAHDGSFIAKNAGTEFSATNSAYAGMILGYTVIGDNATPASYDVTNAMLPVHDDLKVSFVFPPSGKVEIMASIFVQTDNSRPLTFGLSTTNATTGFTSLGAQYENHVYGADETDSITVTARWYITGTAGDSEELWFSAGCTHTNRYDLFWGGDSSSVADSTHPMEYQPFVMRATALPATIYTG